MSDPRLPRFYCMKCGYQWVPRKASPHSCPKCKHSKVLPLGGEEINPAGERERPSGA